MKMTVMEKIELALMAAGTCAVYALAGGLAWRPTLGALVGYGAALLLAQGLARDVARILLTRRQAGEKRRIACLCAESTVGLTLVILGLALTLAGVSDAVEIGRVGLTAGVAGVLLFGFVAKDYVISIKKEKDHASVIVW